MSDYDTMRKLWHIDAALTARDRASWAAFQTAENGRPRTIISVDAEEAIAIEYALNYYIEKFEDAYGREC